MRQSRSGRERKRELDGFRFLVKQLDLPVLTSKSNNTKTIWMSLVAGERYEATHPAGKRWNDSFVVAANVGLI